MSFAIDRATFLSLVATIAACTPNGTRPSEGPSPVSASSDASRGSLGPSAPIASSQPESQDASASASTSAVMPSTGAKEDLLGFDGDTIDHVDIPECARFSWWSCDEVMPPALKCSRTWKDLSGALRAPYEACVRAWTPKRQPASACANHTCSRIHTASSQAAQRLEECTVSSKDPERSCSAQRREAKKTEDASLRAHCSKRTECGEDLSSCVDQTRYLDACERGGRQGLR